MRITRVVRRHSRRLVRRVPIPIRISLQILIVLLVGGAIGLSVMAMFHPKSDERDISRMKQQYPITKYNDLRKPTPATPPDRPPRTNTAPVSK